jgi:hypothetical protein
MSARPGTKFVHEGQYAAEVEIRWIDSGDGWSPYLSLEDAKKLDQVREALRAGDLATAGRLARVYQLTPVARQSSVFTEPTRFASNARIILAEELSRKDVSVGESPTD